MGKNGLVWGVGINDVDEPTKYKVYPEERLPSGRFKYEICPYYHKWRSMIQRCYSTKYQEKQPTYVGCTVSPEWLYFSIFKKWMKSQQWVDLHLDKDFLSEGNKVYSEDACVFIHGTVNSFILDCGANRGGLLLGVTLMKVKYRSQCRNPLLVVQVGQYIGTFDTELEAHLAWKKRKHYYAVQLASSEYVTDDRVREVLRNKYKNFTVFEKHIS